MFFLCCPHTFSCWSFWPVRFCDVTSAPRHCFNGLMSEIISFGLPKSFLSAEKDAERVSHSFVFQHWPLSAFYRRPLDLCKSWGLVITVGSIKATNYYCLHGWRDKIIFFIYIIFFMIHNHTFHAETICFLPPPRHRGGLGAVPARPERWRCRAAPPALTTVEEELSVRRFALNQNVCSQNYP